MRKLFEAAFYPPPRAADAGDQSRFAVLPQNTEDELTLSEVHSKLDRALNFLQRDVGYLLLDDVRPDTGGGVRLRPAPRMIDAVPKGDRSAKMPKEFASRTSSETSAEDLEMTYFKLIFQRSGGKVRASELVEEVYRKQPSNVRLNGQLDRLFRGINVDRDREITWQEFEAFYADSKDIPASGSTAPAPQALSDPQADEILDISPEIRKYVHFQCDIILVSRFTHIIYKLTMQDMVKDVEAGLISEAEAEKRCSSAVKHEGVYKCVLQGVRLMHLCDYDYADVVLVLAYASVYFRSTFSSIGKKMSPNEAAHVVVLLIYLAHAFLLDETCPLRIWQKHIFRKYCTLKVLDAALFRLFQMRPGFKLRISDEEERLALLGLSGVQYHRQLVQGARAEAPDGIAKQLSANCTHSRASDKDALDAGTVSNGFPKESSSALSSSSNVKNGVSGTSNGVAAVRATTSLLTSGRGTPDRGTSDRKWEGQRRPDRITPTLVDDGPRPYVGHTDMPYPAPAAAGVR